MSRVLCSLMLALAMSLLAFGTTPAFATHNGWDTTSTQGGSTQGCNNTAGCTTVSQPKGQVDNTSTNNSPSSCTGPCPHNK
jgi:hypothetical protein